METEQKPKLRPDFNQWLETEDGLKCNNFSNLNEQKYLTNRLAWAFDAGRDCIWDQYLQYKKYTEQLQKESAEQDHAILALQEENRRLKKEVADLKSELAYRRRNS